MQYFDLGKAKVWLALDSRKVIGYAQFFQKDDKRVHLNAIAVRKEYQNQGIGTLLIEAVEKCAREYGANAVELFCNESNENAKRFYSGIHYNVERLLMSKQLT